MSSIQKTCRNKSGLYTKSKTDIKSRINKFRIMKNQILFSLLLSLFFMIPVKSSARKIKTFKRNWSVSIVNGYSFAVYPKRKGIQNSKPSKRDPFAWEDLEGQMHPFFSSLEISRNMGYYEIGAKIQNLGPTFVSPFFKLNFPKNNSRAVIMPSLTLGIVPSHIMGAWLRVGVSLSLHRYFSIAPFIGVYSWYKIRDDARYEKNGRHWNTGLRINLYY